MIAGHFISSPKGKIFVTQTGDLPAKTAILCLPPLFEELNLSRAVMAKQAHYFATNGLPCFVLDYLGTGDSEGELQQFTPEDWLQNVIDIGQWILSQDVEELIIWGVRFGGLLALHYQQSLHQALPIKRQLLWKPILKGKSYMNQFIRLKQANSMMTGDAPKTNWRQQIADGNATEIAGYEITSKLLTSLDSLEPLAEQLPCSRISWMELAATKLTPVISKFTADWPDDLITIHCLENPAFWQIPEIFALQQHYQINLTAIQE